MKVVEYLHTTRGGHMVYTLELASGMRAAGAEVDILTGENAEPMPNVWPRIPNPDTSLRHGPRWALNRLWVYARQTAHVIDFLDDHGGGADAWMHCQELPTLGARRFVRKLRKRGWKVCVTVHNVVPHQRGRAAELTHRGQEIAWREADLLVVHTDGLRDQLVARLGTAFTKQVVVVPHPVWADQEPVSLDPFRDLLFFGHLRENKGIEYFIEALAVAGDPLATIAGSGSPERVAHLRNLIIRLGLRNVDFRPEFIDDAEIPALFAQHRVVVAPYVGFEAQSGVTHLAVAHDRPVVVSSSGGLGQLVRDFGVGEICNDLSDLASVMVLAVARSQEGVYASSLQRARGQLSPKSVGASLVRALAGHEKH